MKELSRSCRGPRGYNDSGCCDVLLHRRLQQGFLPGPFSPPSYPSLAGHWVGSGSYFDGGTGQRLTLSWVWDLATRTDTTFAGNKTGTYTSVAGGIGSRTIWGSRGSVTLSRQVTITDTSGVYIGTAGQTIPIIAISWERGALVYLPMEIRSPIADQSQRVKCSCWSDNISLY